ncbi:hypothetical protein MGYG_05446 [Nannizzia gypsea CBS 118893]|uniref:Uncharacterized protein n=1 Tax=Arthroderma gypseum (strain ATCC MYA-4604 / CBS 118893) TaxID=535722 RepID=E4UW04_ARTGP|nr:hypothetical protein MGYG_05446 [Nannizzia gypsea CBS 118893]EFR02452.1 hypothetical protein MGYG_05446 [Nannizzia gypsea CBS 118893]
MANQEGFPTAHPDTLPYESSYREYVLRLSKEEVEVEELEILRQQALDLGLSIKGDSVKPNGRLEPTSETCSSSTTTSSTLVSPSQVTIPSSVSSSTQRVPSSAHSVSSMATCPPTCKEGEKHQKLSIFSPAPTRHSFDASYFQDHRFTTGFRQSIISRFPLFKKRLSVPDAVLSKPPPPPSALHIFPQDYTVEARVESAASSEAPSPAQLEIPETEELIDMDSVARSLSCSILITLREIHEGQKKRHLQFKEQNMMPLLKRSGGRITKTKRHLSPRQAIPKKRSFFNVEELHTNESVKNAVRAARIEERDLVAEISLVAELQHEKKSLQTSIRHMEAYFSTPPPSLSSDKNDFYANLQPREFTNQKRRRLFQSYHELATLDALHRSKIKVLRDRQARAFEESWQAMELDSIELAKKNREILENLERQKQNETVAVLAWLDGKKRELIYRWELEERIARKRLEEETGLTYGPLPTISFNEGEYDGLASDI